MAQQLTHLFSPLKIGSMTVKNRIFIAAHHTHFVKDKMLSERALHYHAERAKGGFGLIIAGQTQVHPTGGTARPISYSPEVVPIYTKIAQAVHQYGCKILVQLNHFGRNRVSGTDDWDPVWGPSAIPSIYTGEMPKVMEKGDINEVVAAFAKCAKNVQVSGMDGVEIQSGHTYLLSDFLSPLFNKRSDEYGGSLDNRLRIVLEIIDAVRAECGRDFVVGLRINAEQVVQGGLSQSDCIEIARKLEQTGKVDFLDVSIWPGELAMATTGSPLGILIPYAAAIRSEVSEIPILAVGRIVDPIQAEQIIAEGQADMVGMTRASICDPELPNKAKEGRFNDIRLCVGCSQGCVGRDEAGCPITCIQNPTVGREREWGMGTLRPTKAKKKILIVGGGPAGLKAAEVTAARGHNVTLCEKSGVLGGQVNLILKTPRRQEFSELIEYLVRQIKQLGVEIKLNTEVTPDMVNTIHPDAVVLATGAIPRLRGWYVPRPDLPEIPGADQPNVFSCWDVLNGRLEGRNNILLVDDSGSYQSLDALEYLLAHGHKVFASTSGPLFARQITIGERGSFNRNMRGKQVEFLPLTIVNRISKGSVELQNVQTGQTLNLTGIDGVVLSIGNDPDDTLYQSLNGKVKELYRIGDCLQPRRISNAMFEGLKLGREI